MSNDLTKPPPGGGDDDDGFGGGLTPSQSVRNYARWTDNAGWFDRDGMAMPSPVLIPAINEGLQKWKDKVPEFIWNKPLPDPEQLNDAIPKSEWEKGLDGNLRPPWEHIVAIILVNPGNGAVYRFTSPTKGARAAFDQLKEQVVTMRMLRGTKVVPIVNLSERPWKTNYGMKKRPHFHIIGWKMPGEDGGGALPSKPTPQISGPTSSAPQTPPTSPPAPTSTPDSAPYQAKLKPPINLTGEVGETLRTMGDVKPVTMGEIVDDEIAW